MLLRALGRPKNVAQKGERRIPLPQSAHEPEGIYVWMQRFMEKYKKLIWINPYPKDTWNYTASTGIIRELINDQMYPLTLQGLEEGMRFLAK